MAHFIVDRSKWYRGQGSTNSKLLREDGTRCCIGFVGNQCGIEDANLLNRASINLGRSENDIENEWPRWMTQPSITDSFTGCSIGDAYEVNDSRHITEPNRELQLIEIFAKHGDTLEFIN